MVLINDLHGAFIALIQGGFASQFLLQLLDDLAVLHFALDESFLTSIEFHGEDLVLILLLL